MLAGTGGLLVAEMAVEPLVAMPTCAEAGAVGVEEDEVARLDRVAVDGAGAEPRGIETAACAIAHCVSPGAVEAVGSGAPSTYAAPSFERAAATAAPAGAVGVAPAPEMPSAASVCGPTTPSTASAGLLEAADRARVIGPYTVVLPSAR